MLLLAACAILQVGDLSVTGGYRADWSRAVGSHDPLKGFFGQTKLRLKPNGEFRLMGERMKGFWRKDGKRIVLVYSGFFGTPYAVPDEVLKRRWPKGQLQGMVLDVGTNHTLVLRSFGSVQGPITFHRLPSRSIEALLTSSDKIESEDDFAPMDAYEELADRLPKDWPKLLEFILDVRKPLALRRWGTYFLGNVPRAGQTSAIRLLALPELVEPKTREAKSLQRSVVSNLARTGAPGVAEAFLENASRLKIGGSDLARASAVPGNRQAIPSLLDLLRDKSEYVREYALDALAAIGADDQLPRVREMTADASPQVRIAAWCAVLELSKDFKERNEAVLGLASQFDKEPFGNGEILKAMGKSRLAAALPYLSHRLLNVENPREQAIAATALGEVRLRGGVSALLIAKKLGPALRGKPNPKMSDMDKAMMHFHSVADVQKAVVEALWSYHKQPLATGGKPALSAGWPPVWECANLESVALELSSAVCCLGEGETRADGSAACPPIAIDCQDSHVNSLENVFGQCCFP